MKSILILLLSLNFTLFSQTDSVKRYYNKVVYNNEYSGKQNIALKWKKNIKIFVMGDKPDYLITELKNVVKELNDLINPITISIVNSKDQSNFIIYLGTHTNYSKYVEPYAKPYLNDNYGLFVLYGEDQITSGSMYVDLYRTTTINSRKHLLREELTQSLGLQNDTYDYPNSIFYQGWTETTQYANIDKELIKLLYNK